jgi:hypothetical protein
MSDPLQNELLDYKTPHPLIKAWIRGEVIHPEEMSTLPEIAPSLSLPTDSLGRHATLASVFEATRARYETALAEHVLFAKERPESLAGGLIWPGVGEEILASLGELQQALTNARDGLTEGCAGRE